MTSAAQHPRSPLLVVPPLLTALWVAVMVAIPILRWMWGDGALPVAATAAVTAQAAAVLALLARAWGAGVTLRVAGLVLALAWAAEFVGSRSGVPFGTYHYTQLLRPQLAGVPLLIPLAWLMMLPPAWAVAHAIVGHRRPPAIAAVAALAFTAWDLFLDPQMAAWGLWLWQHPHGYFGIPWVNFVGWLLCAFVISLTVLHSVRPPAPPLRPLLLIYTITWALQSIGLMLFWGLPGPAAAGFVVMGLFAGGAWWRVQARANQF